MKHKLDLETWIRKDHFNFFNTFEEPFFGICVPLDCTFAHQSAKKAGVSFFLYYLHKAIVAANKIEPFRYRIEGSEVMVFDEVHPSATINRPNGTFGFSYIPYHESFDEFVKDATVEIDRVKNSSGLRPAGSGENVIHFSSLPWLNFTSLSHARNFSYQDSCPKISFGMMTESNGKLNMQVSIHAHHALMDGYHVAEFVNLFQELMNS
jgi:chloramphenicol O-acetyltransferase type A